MTSARLSPAVAFKTAGVDKAGLFSGYASTFNGPADAYGDVIAPGAFSKTLASGRVPAMLWAHDPSEPIGKWLSLTEDRLGLRVEGKLTLGTKRGVEAHALMLDRALGLSIGFRNPMQGVNKPLKSLKSRHLPRHVGYANGVRNGVSERGA